MYWVYANDGAIQPDSRLDDESSKLWSDGDKELSDDLVEDDVKSLSGRPLPGRSINARRSLSQERSDSLMGKWTEAITKAEPVESEEVREEGSWGHYAAQPKKSKNSRISAKANIFEQ